MDYFRATLCVGSEILSDILSCHGRLVRYSSKLYICFVSGASFGMFSSQWRLIRCGSYVLEKYEGWSVESAKKCWNRWIFCRVTRVIFSCHGWSLENFDFCWKNVLLPGLFSENVATPWTGCLKRIVLDFIFIDAVVAGYWRPKKWNEWWNGDT